MLKFFRRRLYLQIYVAILGIIVLIVLVVGAGFALFKDEAHGREAQFAATMGELLLPPGDAPVEALRERLALLHQRLELDLTILDPSGAWLASAGPRVPQMADGPGVMDNPGANGERRSWVSFRRGMLLAGVQLDDRRWLLLRRPRDEDRPVGPLLLILGGVVALAAYPLARRITRRLERLRGRVDALGAGDLSSRVDVEGIDEVAAVAESFNRSAARIEQLVDGQRAMLAGASHELRTPLTRMRMAIELLDTSDRPALGRQMGDDIEELDHLIEELLMASRLELDRDSASDTVRIDLLGVAVEEAARTGAQVSGESVEVNAEPRWLARAIRNLLENARKYGGPSVTVQVRSDGREAVLIVEDDGDGVPEHLRELIFEPFFRPPGLREGRDRGVGLGLALVRRIARRHGGDVHCDARGASAGSRFTLSLPLAGQ